jgi:PASTA domain
MGRTGTPTAERISRLALVAALASAALLIVLVPAAGAANSPTFRDCSLLSGFDPDSVQLSGVTGGPGGTLTTSQGQVNLQASESLNAADQMNHVTFKATVSTANAASRTLSGAGTGKVNLTIPMIGSGMGRSETISWAATFDNGNHPCPSSMTPQNTTPQPFIVIANGSQVCLVPHLKGKSLKAAKKALGRANCSLGKVKGQGGKVKSQKPKAGTSLPVGSKVSVKLG